MATMQHYIWATGHFILLVSALRYLFAWAMLQHPSVYWYKAAFTGAFASYAIVCQKSLGIPQPNAAWVRRALADENVQYFMLAMFWWTSKPVAIALLPYTIFSLFHALTFTRTTLMPQLLAQGPPTTPNGAPQPHPLAKRLQVWVKANYDRAMKVVAYTEVLILIRVLLGALTLQNSFLTPIAYAHFVRMRYFQSTFTKEAIHTLTWTIDGYVSKPEAPPVLLQVWRTFQSVIGRWTGVTLPARPQAPAPAAR
ncbi:hypothetical protein EWM64_g5334 [Hericium alpestre]|uniref:Endoplasmic reticulum protein n=1 Tax=Hericium alpestre TaxID=135208 RepID=A0A4Y9ZXN9_9AGAM|nr:hypothetical protein EWM64_g5334 [Hericium alpestre]